MTFRGGLKGDARGHHAYIFLRRAGLDVQTVFTCYVLSTILQYDNDIYIMMMMAKNKLRSTP